MHFRLILSTLLFLSMDAKAIIVASPEAIIVKQINGQLYHQTRHQWAQTESLADIINQPLNPANWHQVIASGEPELAKALLSALGELLTRREFLPYAFSGMHRTPDPATRPSQTVAARAYRVYSQYGDSLTNARFRTHPVFNKHLEPVVYWDDLFDTNETFSTTQKAIDYLKNPLRGQTRSHDFLLSKAIRTIALHRDVKDLEVWMKDDHFAVALGSWLALANIKPLSVAEDITEHALWWQAELPFTYGSGCVRSTGRLTPVIAALEIFSDYLSAEQLNRIFNDIPETLNERTLMLIRVNNHQLYQAMKNRLTDQGLSHPTMQNFTARELVRSDEGLSKLLSDGPYGRIDMNGIAFDRRALTFARDKLREADESYDIYALVIWAFNDRSDTARQFISEFLAAQHTPKDQTDWARLMLDFHPIWPTDWLDLKQQYITLLKGMDDPPADLNLQLL